jgi:hypothetical protein
MLKKFRPVFILFPLVSSLILAVPAVSAPAAKVTFTKNEVFLGEQQEGPWKVLEKGMGIQEGQFVKTGKSGLVEITLPDKSVVRLAPDTVFRLDQAYFPKEGRRKFRAKIFLGKLWAKITRIVGDPRGSFDVQTPTAVVGVRGTVYNLLAKADKSLDVLVYEGRVGVKPPLISKGAKKKEISWPREVSEKQWEEIILGKLRKLHIRADGTPEKPKTFDPKEELDEWVKWNQDRDAMGAAG